MNPMYIAIQLRRKLLEYIPTYCMTCRQRISYMETDDEGTFTHKCGCGCSIYKQHEPDEHNETYYYTKVFVSKKNYKKDYKNKDSFEKLGFTKNGEGKYVK